MHSPARASTPKNPPEKTSSMLMRIAGLYSVRAFASAEVTFTQPRVHTPRFAVSSHDGHTIGKLEI